MKGLREGWRELAADWLAERLKFIDEAGSGAKNGLSLSCRPDTSTEVMT